MSLIPISLFSTKSRFFTFVFLGVVSLNFSYVFPRWLFDLRSFIYSSYVLLHLPLVGCFLYMLWVDWRSHNGISRRGWEMFRAARIPSAAKYLTLLVIIVNFVFIAIGKSSYPFYDVGMFRWSVPFENPTKVVYTPKYYYWKQGRPEIVDLRKEHLLFFADHFGWGYNNEFTFSAAFHHKNRKATYTYLLSKLQSLGVSQLWMGIHSVDYETGRVSFDTDPIRAVEINKSEQLHYGPIYVPDHQIEVYENRYRQ